MCDMRGMLSFTILWLLSKRPMYGQELATEIGNRRGDKPNPGTIYPALKELAARRLIEASPQGRNSVYELTTEGKATLERSMDYFERAFGDIFNEMRAGPPGATKVRARRPSCGSTERQVTDPSLATVDLKGARAAAREQDRDSQPHQGLREGRRAEQRLARGRRGRDTRPPRAERRGEEHPDEDSRRDPAPHHGLREGGRERRREGAGGREEERRLPTGEPVALHRADGERVPEVPREDQGRPRRPAAGQDLRGADDLLARGEGGRHAGRRSRRG